MWQSVAMAICQLYAVRVSSTRRHAAARRGRDGMVGIGRSVSRVLLADTRPALDGWRTAQHSTHAWRAHQARISLHVDKLIVHRVQWAGIRAAAVHLAVRSAVRERSQTAQDSTHA